MCPYRKNLMVPTTFNIRGLHKMNLFSQLGPLYMRRRFPLESQRSHLARESFLLQSHVLNCDMSQLKYLTAESQVNEARDNIAKRHQGFGRRYCLRPSQEAKTLDVGSGCAHRCINFPNGYLHVTSQQRGETHRSCGNSALIPS